MSTPVTIAKKLFRSLERRETHSSPYAHWILKDVFPKDVCDGVRALPIAPAHIDDTLGRRDAHNESRVFFSVENRKRFEVCRSTAAALQDTATVRRIERTFNTDLKERYLRIEYCQDTAGFYLEPHTDIGAKVFTMQIYLSPEPEAEAWGTDVLDENKNITTTVRAIFNSALVFVPAKNTWHAYHRRPMAGVRRSLIVNYVKDEWRARHELAYPDQPVA